jgi:DNA-binding Lrp family transcriptional regulator
MNLSRSSSLAENSFDDLELGVMNLLISDGRMPLAHMAASLGASVSAVRQRADRLLDRGVLHVVGLVDPALLGTPVVAYLHIGVDGDATTVARDLGSLAEVQWIVTLSDLITVIAQVSVADNETLLTLMEEQVRPIAGVRSVQSEPILRSFTSAFSFAGVADPADHDPVPWVAGRDRGHLIDATDRAILLALQEDGRMSFTELANRCGLSVPATRQRFLRMRKAEMFRIQSRIEPTAVGLHGAATIRVLTRHNSTTLARALARHPAAAWIAQTAGEFNVAMEIVCQDRDQLSAVFQEIRERPDVLAARLLVHEEVVKSTARWAG